MRKFSIFVILVFLILASAPLEIAEGKIKNPTIMRIVLSKREQFVSYDFCSKSLNSDDADKPMTILFYGYAYSENTIYRILKKLGAKGGDRFWQASTRYALVKVYGRWYWDATDGVKFYDAIPDDYEDDWEVHVRVYNGGYDKNFGYWCVASTHVEQFSKWDMNAQNPELGEDYIAYVFKKAGYTVYEDLCYINNSQPGTQGSIYDYEGYKENHYNNGYITLIYIPRSG